MTNSTTYKYLFFFIVAFYCLILSQFGLENFDTGYIPSFSWRIINGEDVYQDFIYKGPPVTLYFHAFIMKILPETGQFFIIRIINYLFFALQVFLSVSGFYSIYDFTKIRVDKWAVMCVCFVISLLNFSPYPWPTTDGLLFASIAFWLVSKYKDPDFLKLFLIAFFCVLSALTKQSFYLIPFVFLAWIYINYGLKRAFYFFIQIIFLTGVYFSYILSITTFGNFIKQTTGETHLHQLFYTGFHNYIIIPVNWFLLISSFLFLSVFLYLYLSKQKATVVKPYLKWATFLVFSIALLLLLFKQAHIASRIAFDACIIGLLYAFFFQKKTIQYLAPIITSLSIAWSASISLGYQFPILYATGIILSLIVLLKEDIQINPKYYLLIAFPLCIIAFSYNLRPYRESNIFDLTYSLESVSPKLKYIKTNKHSFEKHLELKHLIQKYGENFIVAPNLPMANYLFDDQSELPADWIIITEVDRRNNLFIRLASNKKNYIFLEKSFIDNEECMPGTMVEFSPISWFIYKKFKPIDETKYFIIYNSLKENEKLP